MRERAATERAPGRSAPELSLERRPLTTRFVKQHEELAMVAKGLVKTLDSIKLADDPTPARRELASFSGKLRVHAAMEQDALYPRLLASPDPAVRAKARDLLDEVGSLYEMFFEHLRRWADGDAIKADPERFCRETMQMLYALKVRMKRENEELYPLVDAQGQPSVDGQPGAGDAVNVVDRRQGA